jgi:hypothetical protein
MHEHPTEDELRAFADGKAGQDDDIEVEGHLMSCSGRCLDFLDSLPDPFNAALQAIIRRSLRGRGGSCSG